jgi:uncharacterized protein YjdB
MNKRWFTLLLAPLVPLLMAGSCGGSVVATITVTPNPATVITGNTVAFTAVAKDAGGNVVISTFTWSSSDTAKATVNASTGVATGVAAGSATITATAANGATGSAPLTVTAANTTGVWDASNWDSSATWGP